MDFQFEQACMELVMENRIIGFLLNACAKKKVDYPEAPLLYWTFRENEFQLNYQVTENLNSATLKNKVESACIDILTFHQFVFFEMPLKHPSSESMFYFIHNWNNISSQEQNLFTNWLTELLQFIGPPYEDSEIFLLKKWGIQLEIFRPEDEYSGHNWKLQLRNFVNKGMRTQVRNSSHRISKRYGTFPGLKIRSLPKIGIGIDVSGSISKELMESFWNEVNHIFRQERQLEICEFDHRVQRVSFYHPSKKYVIGKQGGTNFNPLIKWANDASIQGLIIFTDGLAPAPLIKPTIPCLWVFSEETGGAKKSFPGKHLFLIRSTETSEFAIDG